MRGKKDLQEVPAGDPDADTFSGNRPQIRPYPPRRSECRRRACRRKNRKKKQNICLRACCARKQAARLRVRSFHVAESARTCERGQARCEEERVRFIVWVYALSRAKIRRYRVDLCPRVFYSQLCWISFLPCKPVAIVEPRRKKKKKMRKRKVSHVQVVISVWVLSYATLMRCFLLL